MKKTIAVYLRLSKEDSYERDESNSITNQRTMIVNYIKKYALNKKLNVEEYVDDGYSGKNMERPGIQKLLQDMRNRIITIIIVKDFSRMARDHIVMGELIDKVFPSMQVRFIAINNNYDSIEYKNRTPEMDVAFQNLVNDFISEETSQNIRKNFAIKRERGDYFGNIPPLGFVHSQESSAVLVKDYDSGALIQWIFEKRCIDKMTKVQIAKILNVAGVPTPGVYLKEKGYGVVKTARQWTGIMITHILSNPLYVGIILTEKYKVLETGSRKKVLQPKKSWHVSWGRHEPLVSLSMFFEVQNMDGVDYGYLFYNVRAEEIPAEAVKFIPKKNQDLNVAICRKKKQGMPEEEKAAPVCGLVYCGGCGHKMGKKYYKQVTYFCPYRQAFKETACMYGSVKQKELEKIVLVAINTQIEKNEYLEELAFKRKETESRRKIQMMQKQSLIKQKIKAIGRENIELYENYQDGLLGKDLLLQIKKEKNDRKHELELEAEDLGRRILTLKDNQNSFLGLFAGRVGVKSLTREITEQLIEKIVVYDKNQVEVVFKFADEYRRLLSD